MITSERGPGAEPTAKKKIIHRLPDIIGKPKPGGRQSMPKGTDENTSEKSTVSAPNFDTITEVRSSAVPQEEPGNHSDVPPSWMEEEEEEWSRDIGFSTEDGLATGVTFDELATVGMLLERKALGPSEKDKAASMIAKIDGTELLGLLESQVGEASRKIAMLLDRELTS
ncbi:conjugal transfer protein TraD [Flavobacterium sp. ST-75]|uniref:Conjugal transfer protein TraD n=1 Tax=Flavobacterium rhizophilum TaxID=3163296 RepID=A0ABW8Y9S2_9FLAO